MVVRCKSFEGGGAVLAATAASCLSTEPEVPPTVSPLMYCSSDATRQRTVDAMAAAC